MMSMQKIKAVFFDIDGTLVSFDTHQVPTSSRQAIEALRHNGIKVFIASGRHIQSIDKLPDMIFDGFVLINGTLALSAPQEGASAVEMCRPLLSGREVIYRKAILQEDVYAWLDLLKTEEHSTILVYEEGLMLNYLDDTMAQILELLDFPMPQIGDLNQLREEKIYQIITTFTDEEEAGIMQHLPHCKTTRWHPLLTDIINRDASKGLGIQAVLDHYGWTRDEVMAFGDGGNDIEMLDLVGTGIAMGNASDVVKAHADYVTESLENDGVAKALQHFGLLTKANE